jgi:acrylyl-CoA reductase (NADPH)
MVQQYSKDPERQGAGMERFKAFKLTEVDKKIRAEFVDCALEDLDPGNVVVRVAYSDVNYKDALAATGKGKILRRPQCIGGIDFSGTVVSSDDPRFAKGDAVLAVGYDLGVAHHGGYAQYARVPADWLTKLPPGMSLWEAMAFGTAGFTAAIGIERMEHNGLKPANGPVIVNGATGGVGSIAIAALARLGYQVVALTGKESESEWLKKLGAKEVRLRSSIDFSKVRPLDKATWAGAVDNLGGEVLAWICSTMNVNGVIASIGLAASPALNTTVLPFILRGASLLGINSTDSPWPELRATVWRRLGSDMKPPMLKEMCRTIAFGELPSVFEDFINAKVTRRVVVDLSE